RALAIRVRVGRAVEQGLQDAPGLLDAVLSHEVGAVTLDRAAEEYLVGAGALSTLGGELHVELDLLGSRRVRAARVENDPDPGRGVHPDDQLAGDGPAVTLGHEAKPRRVSEHQPLLGLGDRETLAGTDEKRHPRPTPV